MSGWSEAEIEIKKEMEEGFSATLESIKSEVEREVDIEPVALPENYEVPRIEANSQYSEVSRQSNDDVSLSSRCRLCAVLYSNMVDIFSSPEMEDILEKISYSLPIMVAETDTLPKQVCHFCLEELNRCYLFHKTVAEAEKQLLALDKLAPMKSEETERNDDFFPHCDEQRGPTECNNIHASLRTTTITEEAQTSRTNVESDDSTPSWKPCAVWLPITETRYENNSYVENDKKSSIDTRDGNLSLTNEICDSKQALVPEIDEQSTCDFKVHIKNPEDFAPTDSGKELHECNICAKSFKWKSHLTRHIEVHKNANKRLELHKCNVCTKMFKRRSNLTYHSRVHMDEGLELYKCNTCDKTFKWKTNLLRHSVDHMDEDINRHKCNICAMTFKWKTDLTEHSTIHTNKGLYSCEYCGKKFGRRKMRDRHHHVHTKEKPFECSVCKKSFNDQANLKRHAAVHSEERNYPCSLCDKSFKLATNRQEHMFIHTGSKPWPCSYCTKTFLRQRDLERHLRICQKRS